MKTEKLSTFLDGMIASRSGAVALYLQNKYGFTPNKPITKPTEQLTNHCLIQLNPTKFEPLMQNHETQHIEKEPPLHLNIWDFLLVAVGIWR